MDTWIARIASTKILRPGKNSCANGMTLLNRNVLNGIYIQDFAYFSVAFLAFIIDSQHSMIFGHSLVLHARELNLKLPYKEDVWDAGSADAWQRAIQCHYPQGLITEPEFMDILRIFTDQPSQAKDTVLTPDPFTASIILHGLINVKWHQQRNAFGIGTFLAVHF